jgi:hypothetical protein
MSILAKHLHLQRCRLGVVVAVATAVDVGRARV